MIIIILHFLGTMYSIFAAIIDERKIRWRGIGGVREWKGNDFVIICEMFLLLADQIVWLIIRLREERERNMQIVDERYIYKKDIIRLSWSNCGLKLINNISFVWW